MSNLYDFNTLMHTSTICMEVEKNNLQKMRATQVQSEIERTATNPHTKDGELRQLLLDAAPLANYIVSTCPVDKAALKDACWIVQRTLRAPDMDWFMTRGKGYVFALLVLWGRRALARRLLEATSLHMFTWFVTVSQCTCMNCSFEASKRPFMFNVLLYDRPTNVRRPDDGDEYGWAFYRVWKTSCSSWLACNDRDVTMQYCADVMRTAFAFVWAHGRVLDKKHMFVDLDGLRSSVDAVSKEYKLPPTDNDTHVDFSTLNPSNKSAEIPRYRNREKCRT